LPSKVEQNTIYFPKNNWQLNSYQENGVEFIVPLQVNATMIFIPVTIQGAGFRVLERFQFKAL